MIQTNHSEQTQWAASLYISQNMGIPEIAAITGLDEVLITRLSLEQYWDDRRLAAFSANQVQLQRLYVLLDQVTARSQNAGNDASQKDASLIKNYAEAIQKLESKDGPAKTIQVAIPFTSWLLKKDVNLTKAVALYFDEFIKEQLRQRA